MLKSAPSTVPPTSRAPRPIRVGVFSSAASADHAVEGLLLAGFTKAEITVVCNDQAANEHFRPFEHQHPAGTFTPTTAVAGGVIGAVLGGLTVAIGAAATGGAALLATAPIAVWGGGAAGGLIGAMMSRGVEQELANFYDQAVSEGQILVAVDIPNNDIPDDNAARLALAAKILAEAGAKPLKLPEQ
ncbi:MAG: hypothetical protein K8T25_14320 [Planctomycetia bacterium]|nr:hypothetical protein [Planctomycetia bacterium]